MARLAGVSAQTVSRFFTGVGYVHADTRERISAAVDELGYRPNHAARNLRSRRSDSVGVLSMGGLNHGTATLLTGLSETARAVGFDLSTTHLDLDFAAEGWQEEARRSLERFLSIQVDGIIVATPVLGVEEVFPDPGDPTPLLTISERPHGGLASASMHSHGAGVQATEHLLSLGHTRVLHVAGPRTRNEAFERERGYREAMAAAGLEPLVAEGARDWTAESGFLAARSLDPSSFTAVFAANDELALGVMSAMSARGLTAPADFSIVGVDDMPSSAFFSPPLTSVRLDFRRLGREAFRLLHRLIRDDASPERVVVEPELVVRGSTARRPGAARARG
ncbi:LacI family DNA-binding transcriptional regulator [Microbacterium betulae]|uniref:LacI family DNA-binding transcriptional regulator n=1 Tax=Microbacterium betulae TaxID=2981139 RepID=A0AA97I6R1_9MICO|nr:LacI family DNA-binding transcriptional regulator [Microbacterium sp. AB]WOF22892.1 LacI family DNA-binding transcriptional regulator [Microbacterium sp. AB]